MKIYQNLQFLFLMCLAFVACKKLADSGEIDTISQNQAKIQIWFNNKKTNNSVQRNAWIDALNNNLLYDKLWTEKNGNVQYLIVPINDNFKFKNNKGQRARSYFVSALNASSKIIYSVIVQYRPNNSQTTTHLAEGSIADIFNNKALKEDCNIRVIDIYDNFLYTKYFKDNKYVSTVNLGKKINANNQLNRSATNNGSSRLDNCIDWYWVTTYADGTQTWEFAFTTCETDSCHDSDFASICPDQVDGNGGLNNIGSLPDPCAEAQTGSTNAKNFSQNGKFITVKGSIISAASDGKEHGVTFGKDANGNITNSNISTGSAISGTVPNWQNAFADLHNHLDPSPPSNGDIYGFIDRVNSNNNFETRYILTSSGTMYALVITDLNKANVFNSNFPRVPNPGFSPDFPEHIVDEINEMKGLYGATEEMALAFIMEKYDMGVALLKQDSDGNFKRLNTVPNKNSDGVVISYTAKNCN